MMEKKYAIVLMQRLLKETPGIGLEETACLCCVHPDLIDRFVRLGLVDPLNPDQNKQEWCFGQDTINIIRKIVRLRNQLGINYAGIGIVLDLLSRVEYLESRLLELENYSG